MDSNTWPFQKLTGIIGDKAAVTYGEVLNAVLGINGAIIMGTQMELVIDPLLTTLVPESMAQQWANSPMSQGTSFVLGRNHILFSPRNAFVLGPDRKYTFHNDAQHGIPDNLKDHLSRLCKAVNVLVALGFVAWGTAKMGILDPNNEDTKYRMWIGIYTAIAIAISLIFLGFALAYGGDAIKAVKSGWEACFAAKNVPVLDNTANNVDLRDDAKPIEL